MNIVNIRNYLRENVGFNIIVIYRGSRNRKEVYKGVLFSVYRNVFLIKLFNGEVKSFSYSDVLTRTVHICI